MFSKVLYSFELHHNNYRLNILPIGKQMTNGDMISEKGCHKYREKMLVQIRYEIIVKAEDRFIKEKSGF
jgi:hypothetical protein